MQNRTKYNPLILGGFAATFLIALLIMKNGWEQRSSVGVRDKIASHLPSSNTDHSGSATSETGSVPVLSHHAGDKNADRKSASFVKELLSDPTLAKLPSEIPRLSNSQVQELSRAYAGISQPSEKFGILWALAFSQNDLAFDTLRYAAMEEYSGQALSKTDTAYQLMAVKLIGVLAASSDRAWDFLLDLTQEGAWSRFEGWSADHLTQTYDSEEKSRDYIKFGIRKSVFSALGTSGRPEFLDWAETIRSGERNPPDNLPDIASSISRGVFNSTFIRDQGHASYYDDVLYHSQKGTAHFTRWARAEEGKAWSEWWMKLAGEQATHQRESSGKKD